MIIENIIDIEYISVGATTIYHNSRQILRFNMGNIGMKQIRAFFQTIIYITIGLLSLSNKIEKR